MNRTILKVITAILLTVSVFLVSNVKSEVYVSFNGGFYIEYPDDWVQIDYRTADVFLANMLRDKSALDYEAVFAPKSSSPFHEKAYLVLTIETVDWLYEYREDSIVELMKKSFGEGIEYFPSWDNPGDVKTNRPVYVKEERLISVVNEIVVGDKVIKKSFFVRKFHDKGIANFYFYSPDSTFENNLATFQQVVRSFGTENIDQKLPREKVDIAEGTGDDRAIDMKTVLIAVGLAVVIVAVLLIRTRNASGRKREKT